MLNQLVVIDNEIALWRVLEQVEITKLYFINR